MHKGCRSLLLPRDFMCDLDILLSLVMFFLCTRAYIVKEVLISQMWFAMEVLGLDRQRIKRVCFRKAKLSTAALPLLAISIARQRNGQQNYEAISEMLGHISRYLQHRSEDCDQPILTFPEFGGSSGKGFAFHALWPEIDVYVNALEAL